MEKIKAYLSKDLNGCVDIWNKEPEFDRNIGCFLNDEDSLDLYAGELAELDNLVNKGQCVEITITKGKTIYDYKNTPEGKLMNAIFGGKESMTREEAYNFLEEASSNTQNGPMVHITRVEKAIKDVSDDEELREKALDGIYECEGNCADWMQLDEAKYFIDIALGIEDEFSYF